MKETFLFIVCLLIITCFGACKKETSKSADTVNDDATKTDREESTLTEDNIAAKEDVTDKEEDTRTYYITESFESKALASAMDESSPTKEIKIYLPKSYYDADKRYPAVYYFHGFGNSLSFIIANKWGFEELMVQPNNKEFIVVEVSGHRTTTSEGSFWVNSPVTGQWEDYVIDEIVPYIDGKYKTIPNAESRGVAGFSMGGFASINLAFKHPDIFSSVMAVGPGLLKEGSIEVAIKGWRGDSTFLRCYGQSFAPNIDKDELCDIPTLDGTPEDNEIIEKWDTGFGDLEEKVNAYLELDQELKAVHLIYGKADSYKWIPEGTIDFSRILTEQGIDHELTELNIGHSLPNDYAKDYFVPFFSDSLVFE